MNHAPTLEMCRSLQRLTHMAVLLLFICCALLIAIGRSYDMKAIVRQLALLAFCWNVAVDGYPMIIEVDEEEKRCFNLNVPEDDDAHVIFVPLPYEGNPSNEWSKKYEDMELYFLDQVIKMTKSRVQNTLPRNFLTKTPSNIQAIMEELIRDWYDNDSNALLEIKITNPTTGSSAKFDTTWFTPVVVNHLRRTLHNPKKYSGGDSTPLEGYEICLTSQNEEVPALMMVETVLTSDDSSDSEDEGSVVFQGEHLTPLQDQLDESIRAANTVIRELNLMESRERRMHKTAENINWRVRNFSYVSIFVLVLVTFFQVTYLKRYFHKKKLL